MFDLRYHVASLTAVFLALIIGILVGVGISTGGFVKKSERRILNDRIDELQSRLDAARVRVGDLSRAQRAADTYVDESYPVLMSGLLAKKRVALVFVGSTDPEIRDLVDQTLEDAGAGGALRLRAIRVPVNLPSVRRALAARPGLARLAKPDKVGDLGRRLAQELVSGGKAPAWRMLTPELVEERTGSDREPADAVVVARSVAPQQGPTSRLLRGLYDGLGAAGVPVVGVETAASAPTAIDTFAKSHLSSVDVVDSRVGRFALALLLAGAQPGSYGEKPTAKDGVLPPLDPLVALRTAVEK
jgi:hypothetical protein